MFCLELCHDNFPESFALGSTIYSCWMHTWGISHSNTEPSIKPHDKFCFYAFMNANNFNYETLKRLIPSNGNDQLQLSPEFLLNLLVNCKLAFC